MAIDPPLAGHPFRVALHDAGHLPQQHACRMARLLMGSRPQDGPAKTPLTQFVYQCGQRLPGPGVPGHPRQRTLDGGCEQVLKQ